MSSTTRDRIIDEAMRLFSQHGYAATSIVKIEAAAGLTPGAGGIYVRSAGCSLHWVTSSPNSR